MRLLRAMIGMAVVVAAACGQPTAIPGGEGGPVDVADLLGSWSVTATAPADTILVLHPDGFELRSGPAVRYGSWRADSSGLFVAHVTGASGGARPDMSTPPWLEAAATVTAATGDRLLLDVGGRTTARLSPRAWPPPAPGGPTGRPGPAAPLAAGLEPVEHSRLVGRWKIADHERAAPAPQPPHVDLAPGGAWTGTDGCNNGAGRWTSGPAGALLATSGPMTLMACAGMAPVPGWLGQTARAGFDGATLVLLDADGRELGRLVRSPVAGSARLAPLPGG